MIVRNFQCVLQTIESQQIDFTQTFRYYWLLFVIDSRSAAFKFIFSLAYS